MVSIKDIAAECGVSTATVSKALNGHDDVGTATKERVREAAKRLGYMPNSLARALKTKKSYNIGVLMVDKANSGLQHHYFAAILDSFKVEMERSGYDLTFISSHVGDSSYSYYEHCMYRNVDGVLAACVDFTAAEVQRLFSSDLPIVSIDYISDETCAVVSDNERGIRDLLEYALQKGHKRIAYIYGDDAQVTQARLKAFREVMGEHQCEVNEAFLKPAKYLNPTDAYCLTQELLSGEERPTCILYPDDICAVSGIEAIRSCGLTEGRDVSVMGYDGIPLMQMLRPGLTTVRQDTVSIGRKAAELMLRLVRKEEIPQTERVQYCKGKLLEGETVGTPA